MIPPEAKDASGPRITTDDTKRIDWIPGGDIFGRLWRSSVWHGISAFVGRACATGFGVGMLAGVKI